jgi:hypothetical protein
MCLESVAVKLLRDAGPNSGVKRFCSIPSRNSMSEKNSDPTLQSRAGAHADGLRHKSASAQPINYSGSGTAIPEQCEIP